jgi:hypothetical protein
MYNARAWGGVAADPRGVRDAEDDGGAGRAGGPGDVQPADRGVRTGPRRRVRLRAHGRASAEGLHPGHLHLPQPAQGATTPFVCMRSLFPPLRRTVASAVRVNKWIGKQPIKNYLPTKP